mgnify:CR=1 FL=1
MLIDKFLIHFNIFMGFSVAQNLNHVLTINTQPNSMTCYAPFIAKQLLVCPIFFDIYVVTEIAFESL